MDRFSQDADNAAVSVEYDKYKKLYRKNTVPDGRVLAFLAGFCLGMVFFYLSGIKLLGEEHFPIVLSVENISRLHDFDFYAAGLFEYVTMKRLGQLIFLLICAASFIRKMCPYALLGWGGFEIGIVLFSVTYQYGLKGMLLSIMFMLPHGIFFLLSLILLFDNNWIDNRKAYHSCNVTMKRGLHNEFPKLKKMTIVFLLWFLGIFSEVYINPEIIKKVALFF